MPDGTVMVTVEDGLGAVVSVTISVRPASGAPHGLAFRTVSPEDGVTVVDGVAPGGTSFASAKGAALSGIFYGWSLARQHLVELPDLEIVIERLDGELTRWDFEAFAIAASYAVAFLATETDLLREQDWGKWRLAETPAVP